MPVFSCELSCYLPYPYQEFPEHDRNPVLFGLCQVHLTHNWLPFNVLSAAAAENILGEADDPVPWLGKSLMW